MLELIDYWSTLAAMHKPMTETVAGFHVAMVMR